jgi:DNA-binding transcriptional MocR family regulator
MSWQAIAWSIRQTTGSARRKLLLLALANYADESGVCWPSQETLARDTEQSLDTVQRQLAALEKLKLLARERMPKRRGQWQGHLYKLFLQEGVASQARSAARSADLRPGQAAAGAPTRPQSLRLKPSIEPSIEPSRAKTAKDAVTRQQAFQAKQEGAEVVQNRIARRIGDDGWLVLGDMDDGQRSRLSTLERQGRLDNETLMTAVLGVRVRGRDG